MNKYVCMCMCFLYLYFWGSSMNFGGDLKKNIFFVCFSYILLFFSLLHGFICTNIWFILYICASFLCCVTQHISYSEKEINMTEYKILYV